MDVWNYILGYRNTLKSVFETWVVHIPFKYNYLNYLNIIIILFKILVCDIEVVMWHVKFADVAGELSVTETNCQDLLCAADMLQLPAAVDSCCKFLADRLAPDNCVGNKMLN